MTRKDYIVIADALRTAHKDACASKDADTSKTNTYQHGHVCGAIVGISDAASLIADVLQSDNPRFDREHFMAVVRGQKELLSRPARNGRVS